MALAGACVLAWSLTHWSSENFIQFLAYLGLAILASPLKVNLPGIFSTLSVNYVFVLVAISQVSLSETLVIAVCATIVQCSFRPKQRLKLVHLLFNVSSVILESAICYAVYHWPWLNSLHGGVPALFLATSMVYYAANTLAIASVVALTESRSVVRVWRDNFLWTGPQYLVGATVAALFNVVSGRVSWEWALLVLPAIYVIYSSYRVYLGRVEEERKHATEISELHLRTIEALAVAIEAKDQTTHDHLRRVQLYATEIAKEMGLREEQIQALRAAALLHDIGKLAVPEYILSKPGRLTPEEFERIKIHPLVGAEILERIHFPYPVVPIVAAHHEKWDGSGYPRGLRRDEIPIGARILAAVDCLDALASERQYREALNLDAAMDQVAAQSGSSFEPAIVEVLRRRYRDLEQKANTVAVSDARLSTVTNASKDQAPPAGLPAAEHGEGRTEVPGFINLIAAARQEFQNLHELTTGLGTSLTIEGTLSVLAAQLKNIVPYDSIAIYTLDEGVLSPQYTAGTDSGLFASMRIPLGQGLSGWVAETRKSIINGNPSIEPCPLANAEISSVLLSAIAVPLIGTGGVIGVLSLYSRSRDAFTNDHLRLLKAISSKAAVTIENALEYREARKSAVTDALTGLPNTRSLFLHLDAELARCGRNGGNLSVLVLDLDGFKDVNDRFGHLTGNRVLKRVARGLREVCREYDYVARMGGDEFVIVLSSILPDGLAKKTEELSQVVAAAGQECTGEELLSVSIGEATWPREGLDAEELLAEADRKMYAVKHAHRRRPKRPSPASGVAQLAIPGITVH